jgi:putative restriction endonuclease
MPRFPALGLVQAMFDAFNNSGMSAVLLSSPEINPRQFVVKSRSEVLNIWIYVWTLTHGGGAARPKDEYRIQMTGVASPLPLNSHKNGLTVLVGYEPNLQCFAGFDVGKHTTFTGRSPSIQIPITALHDALQNGMSFFTKNNDEIAVGFRSEELGAYVLNAKMLHQAGADVQMVELLKKAASLEAISDIDFAQVTPERQRVVAIVERLSRDAGFRRKVTTAYNYRCAVTRMQLRLVDAAHILPVGAPGSNDEVYNGLCLSPTYHRAYDRGLIYLDDTYIMRINPAKEQELIHTGQDGGIVDFKHYLDIRIHLPADRNQWPHTSLIQQANTFRSVV